MSASREAAGEVLDDDLDAAKLGPLLVNRCCEGRDFENAHHTARGSPSRSGSASTCSVERPVATNEPKTIITKPMAIPTVSGSCKIATPSAIATAGLK